MKFNECYAELKKAMRLLKKINAFEQFNYLDLFYLIDSKNKGIAIFQDRLMGSSYGLQLHFGDAGINYLYDSYMTNTGLMLNSVFANMMTISMVSKEDLIPDDIAFLKKHKIRIQAKNNLIPCLFQEGQDYSYLTTKNMADAIRYIYYLLSLIQNEREDILKAFSEEQLVLAAFDSVHGYYEVRYTADISLGTMPRFKKANSEFVLEYQGKTYVDETLYVSRYYSPNKVEKSTYYESVLFAYFEQKGTYNLEIISCKPNQISEYLTGFLDDIFKEQGIPMKVIFNERRLVGEAYKTLRALHMDVEFQRETEDIDNLFFEKLQEEIEIFGEGGQKLKTAFVS